MEEPNPQPGEIVKGNLDEPLTLGELNIEGLSMGIALAGEQVDVLQRYGVTSDDYFFHTCATALSRVVEHAAAQSGTTINLSAAQLALIVVKPDKTALAYIDKAAVTMSARLKVSVEAGQPIFEDDFSDISAMSFPFVEIAEDDQVIVTFRDGWRYALYFDLTRKLDLKQTEKTLGRLAMTLRKNEYYAALGNPAFFETLVAAGWFPFLELRKHEFVSLYNALLSGEDLAKCGTALLGGFDEKRVRMMAARWMSNPHFKKREGILMPGVEAFIRGEPVTAIKTLLSEIEGILQDAHIAAHSRDAKTSGLIKFAISAATSKVEDDKSLFFPTEFQQYLEANTYGHFDPMKGAVTASRHGVGHGAAPPEVYTQVRALQVLLTLDQVYFYL